MSTALLSFGTAWPPCGNSSAPPCVSTLGGDDARNGDPGRSGGGLRAAGGRLRRRVGGSRTLRQGGAGIARLGWHPVVLAHTSVHGVPATAWKSRGFDDNVCLSWSEGSTGFALSSVGSPKAPLSVAELRRVAEGLR